MLTFFTTAKPFLGHIGTIQRNALKSWTLLHLAVDVILFGGEEGAAEMCAELGLRHETHVERSHLNPRLPVATHMFVPTFWRRQHSNLKHSLGDIFIHRTYGVRKRLGLRRRIRGQTP